ncbi:MAG: DNA polymerase III subunit beta [Candidatus Omnitrophica bacterium]|nr:DNA polymerase III subunit beta [Candidatus Omnitrophota bacterium]MDD5552468.1 DNA polymerase III subunit beta [Candidatus Omnitrophota bacterium]
MKVEISKDKLIAGIQKVQNVISVRSALPILSNILVEAEKDKIRLTATDLDVGISCVIPVDIQEPGMITIPAKRFGDIIKELPDDKLNINTKKNNLVIIETKSCQFKIMGLPFEDFPKLPEFKEGGVLKIEQAVLKEMLALTSFAVSIDETRYILNGILFKISRDNITLVATDGKRLAVIQRKLNKNTEKDLQIIVPLKTIQELSRNLQEEGEVSMLLGNNQALFDLGDVIIISRLIEGEFPDYQQVIPPAAENKIGVGREQFLLAVKRAALLSTPDYQAVKLEVFKNKMVVSKSTPDVGESREEVPIEYQGKEIVAGFNPSYLMDVLKNLCEERVAFELTDAEKPGVIRINGYVYIVLPMRLN